MNMKFEMLSVVIKKLVWVASSSIVLSSVVTACMQQTEGSKQQAAGNVSPVVSSPAPPPVALSRISILVTVQLQLQQKWLRPNSLLILVRRQETGIFLDIALARDFVNGNISDSDCKENMQNLDANEYLAVSKSLLHHSDLILFSFFCYCRGSSEQWK